jgi:hypothetical protein
LSSSAGRAAASMRPKKTARTTEIRPNLSIRPLGSS